MCSVHRARMSLKVFSILRVERRNFHAHRLYYFCWATLHLFLRYSLAQVAGLFSMRSWWSFPEEPHSRWCDLTSVRFLFTTIPCLLEDGRGVRLCYRWLSPCWYEFVILFRGLVYSPLDWPFWSPYLQMFPSNLFFVRARHFHHVYVAT